MKFVKFLLAALALIIAAVLLLNSSILMRKIVYPIKYEDYVTKFSQKYDMDENFIYAVIKTESNFDKDAVSNVGARGLMQIMPDAFDWIKYRMGDTREITYNDMFNPELNIEYGTYMLMLLYDEYDDYSTSIAAYHAGRTAVNNWLADKKYSQDGATLTVVPSKVTAHYVDKVNKAFKGYNKFYNE
ncbi:MAG: lytic transglycosylase domain-containing protein [Oscillospiraceae bacterium]